MISVRETMKGGWFLAVNAVSRVTGLVEQVVFNPMYERIVHTKLLTVRTLRETWERDQRVHEDQG